MNQIAELDQYRERRERDGSSRGPQVEDGYTRIANELYEVVNDAHACPVNARHLRVIHAIIRRTYGFNKTMDALADTQLAADTSIPRNKVNVAKHELLAMKVLKLSEDGRKIGINKAYSEWDFTARPERKAPQAKSRQNGNAVTKMVTKSVTKSGTHKRQKDMTTADAVVNAQSLRDAFEVFYGAGLPKKDRKRAEDKFKRTAKRLNCDPMELAQYLANDIAKRIAAEQQGIDRLHPTTYLNNERWLDDIEEPAPGAIAPADPSLPDCPHADLLSIWDETCGKVKGKAPNLLDWRGTKSADALAERWAEFYGAEVNGRVRYDSLETGLAWWRMALETIAAKQDFRAADVDIWSLFYKGRFGRAANGNLCGQGGATR
ncbi:replication protein [Halomonas pacifica]|uniref:replication protein n=1 Tax=Bisbaumannia pacifica TaxID=77098 RepID=UPI002359E759|nr:replication protein [Halomonas pacifica]MDC8803913.1 replication protein [Halomonas pacifica]